MSKSYEQYASQVKGFNAIFAESIKKKGEEINAKMTDWRLSDKGKEEAVRKIMEEMQAICENMNKVLYEVVQNFSKEYSLALPNDEKDHSMDIQNAFRVIDMLGYNLDRKNLTNILDPLTGNYRALKTVLDVIRVKNETGLNRYDSEITGIVNEYSGVYSNVSDYLQIMEDIEAIPQNPVGYRFDAYRVSISPLFVVNEHIPYSHLSCADWMIEAGKAYDSLQGDFISLYKKAPQTDKEAVLSAIQG